LHDQKIIKSEAVSTPTCALAKTTSKVRGGLQNSLLGKVVKEKSEAVSAPTSNFVAE